MQSLLFSLKTFAEKVHKSWRQYFATKVRKSSKFQDFLSKVHFCWGYLFKCLNLTFKQWLNIILWYYSENFIVFAENSKLFAESGNQGHPLLECMIARIKIPSVKTSIFRRQWWYVPIPLSDQWWKTIKNHQNRWFPDVFSDVSLNCLPERMHCRIGCICLTIHL